MKDNAQNYETKNNKHVILTTNKYNEDDVTVYEPY